MRTGSGARLFRSTLVLLGLICGFSASLGAQVVIPAGATIDNAELSVYAWTSTGESVNLHRITADWGEETVTWNSFNGSFDPIVIGSFVSTGGWNTVDVTAIVQAWVDGAVPNHGVLLEEGGPDLSRFHSSEYGVVELRPILEIWYTDPSGVLGHVRIQRPDVLPGGVKDAYIMEASPTEPAFDDDRLLTGFANGWEKQSLIQFLFDVEFFAPGTGTPGYWKNHPRAWPVESITIGGVTYEKGPAIRIMKRPIRKDMTKAMFKMLVSAKLNVMIGNDDSCIWEEIMAADAWMAIHEVGSRVRANSAAWDTGEPIFLMLDDYNNGRLPCADHRSSD